MTLPTDPATRAVLFAALIDPDQLTQILTDTSTTEATDDHPHA